MLFSSITRYSNFDSSGLDIQLFTHTVTVYVYMHAKYTLIFSGRKYNTFYYHKAESFQLNYILLQPIALFMCYKQVSD